jgi:hypothetical protein
MDISSPYFVIAVLVTVFAASILFATSSKEDRPEDHNHAH